MDALTAPPHTTSIVAALARTLASEHPLDDRLSTMFDLLRQAVAFHDARLIWWPHGAADQRMRQEVRTLDALPVPWDEHQAEAACARRTPLRGALAHARLAVDGAYAAGDSLATYSAPAVWSGRVLGVLELRALGGPLIAAGEEPLLEALLPLLAAALAHDAAPHLPVSPSPGLPLSRSSSLPLSAASTALAPRVEHSLAPLRANLDAPLTLTSLLEQTLAWARDATGAEAGAVYLVDTTRSELETYLHQGYPRGAYVQDRFGEPRRRTPLDNSAPGHAARTGRADVQHLGQRDSPAHPEIRAQLIAPVLLDGQPLAVFVLESVRAVAFTGQELELISALCAAVAAPLRRALAYQDAYETSLQLGQVFANLPIGLALLDRQGRVLRQNPAWQRVWGIPNTSDAPFHAPWDIVSALLPRLKDPHALTAFDQEPPNGEARTLTVTLREPHQELWLVATPTRDSLGQTVGRLWAVTDVTAEREADRIKTEFISVVTHELRTPLTSILGYADLLQTRSFTPREQQSFVQTIHHQAEHLSHIIDDMIKMTKLEAGTVDLEQWIVAPRQLINETAAQLNAQITSKHPLVIDMPTRLSPIYIDRDKIKQVLVNLLTNAVKYSPAGGEVRLRVEPMIIPPIEHPPGSWMLFAVSDRGMGISRSDQRKIWDRFYRVDNSNTRLIGGTGLGLTITRALVELHGGRIWVESEPGAGSTFYFTVPIATDELALSAGMA